MRNVTITTGTEKEFFKRGKQLAQRIDKAEPVIEEKIISFEDPEDILELLTSARMNLFRAIKEQPSSIAAIARRLHRDRSAVKRDVDVLEKAGLVEVEAKTLPGHGKMKEVRVLSDRFRLEAMFV